MPCGDQVAPDCGPSLSSGLRLSPSRSQGLFSGGQLRPESMALSGPASYEILHTYHVDKTLFSCKGIDMDETMLVTRLEAFGIPCLRQYPNDGQFGKLILGISGSGVDIFVPASVWEDACELIRESDDETEEEQ